MLSVSANFKAKRTAAASHGFLATVRLFCCKFFAGRLSSKLAVCWSLNNPQTNCYKSTLWSTDVSFTVLVFHKIVWWSVWSLMESYRSVYCKFVTECTSERIENLSVFIIIIMLYSQQVQTNENVAKCDRGLPATKVFMSCSEHYQLAPLSVYLFIVLYWFVPN